MAAFRRDEPGYTERLDFRILSVSPVALYWETSVLRADIEWLSSEGYRVETLRTGVAASPEALLAAIGRLLALPDGSGATVDGFNASLSELQLGEPGLVLVLDDFGTFAAAFRRQAQTLLDVCAYHSRRLLLTGERFIVLVHTKDPKLRFDRVGANPVPWNPNERNSATREL